MEAQSGGQIPVQSHLATLRELTAPVSASRGECPVMDLRSQQSEGSGSGAGYLERASADPVATQAQLPGVLCFGSVLGIGVT